MSLFQGFATQRGFNANKVNVPFSEPEKIKERARQHKLYRQQEIDWITRQADRLLNQFESNNAIEAKARENNFKAKQAYADDLAQQKWRNYESAIKRVQLSEQASQKRSNQIKQLASLTVKGAQLYKDFDNQRKEAIDRAAAELYLDHGIGHTQREGLVNAQKTGDLDLALNDSSKLHALLTRLEIDTNTPIDVLTKLARSDGYLPVAMEKLSAIRWGEQLPGILQKNGNEPIDIPGVPTPISYYTAKDPALKDRILNELVRRELTDPRTGNKRFSSKLMHISGLIGPEGTIARAKASMRGISREQDYKDYYRDRHEQNIKIIKTFIGPGTQGGIAVGGQGFQNAIYHFAGGEDASREDLVRAKDTVVDAVIDGLKNDQFTWSEVESWGELPITPRGSTKEVKWKDHFEREWNAIEKAGDIAEADAEKDHQRRLFSLKAQARDDEIAIDKLLAEGNPSFKTLTKLHGEFVRKGAPYAKVTQKLAAAITRGTTTVNDEVGAKVLIERAQRGYIITDQEIFNWNFSQAVLPQVRAEVAKHNRNAPSSGENGTRKQLENRIDGELRSIIKPTSDLFANHTHADAKREAIEDASVYYMDAREKGASEKEAYNIARDLITKDIRDPDGKWGVKDLLDGRQVFKGFAADVTRTHPEDHREKWGKLLQNNPSAIFTSPMMSREEAENLSNRANGGYKPQLPSSMMLVEGLSGGRITSMEAAKAQIEYWRNRDIQTKGATDLQPLPDDYIKLFDAQVENIPARLRVHLNDPQPIGANFAYTSSNLPPPNQDHIYQNIRELVSNNTNVNSIGNDELQIENSDIILGYNLTDVTFGQLLGMMDPNRPDRKFSAFGIGQWDHPRLLELLDKGTLTRNDLADGKNQRILLDLTSKHLGIKGFPHIEGLPPTLFDQLNITDIDPKTYWRSIGSLRPEALQVLDQEGILTYD